MSQRDRDKLDQYPAPEGRRREVTDVDAAAPLPAYRVRRCILCGAKRITATSEGRIVTVQCHACDAIFEVEYDPPDTPNVRARAEIISRRGGPPRD